jgi:hypothetical protein
MGNIIMVVAVLLSHMLRNPVAMMKPRMILLPLVPVLLTIWRAIRLWRFHFSMASPIMNPPMKRKITGLLYDLEVSSMLLIPSNGRRIRGTSATTGMGSVSATHQTIIRIAMATALRASGSRANGLRAHEAKARAAPRKNVNQC